MLLREMIIGDVLFSIFHCMSYNHDHNQATFERNGEMNSFFWPLTCMRSPPTYLGEFPGGTRQSLKIAGKQSVSMFGSRQRQELAPLKIRRLYEDEAGNGNNRLSAPSFHFWRDGIHFREGAGRY